MKITIFTVITYALQILSKKTFFNKFLLTHLKRDILNIHGFTSLAEKKICKV